MTGNVIRLPVVRRLTNPPDKPSFKTLEELVMSWIEEIAATSPLRAGEPDENELFPSLVWTGRVKEFSCPDNCQELAGKLSGYLPVLGADGKTLYDFNFNRRFTVDVVDFTAHRTQPGWSVTIRQWNSIRICVLHILSVWKGMRPHLVLREGEEGRAFGLDELQQEDLAALMQGT